MEPGNERFILPVSAASSDGGNTGPAHILVNNFFEELNRLVPE